MQVDDFAREYKAKLDNDLLRLALVSDQLTDDANIALSAELRSCGLDKAERMQKFREEEEANRLQRERDIGRLWFLYQCGIGRKRFCKSAYVFDPTTRLEEFSTTVFVVLFWLPLVPTGTYRIRREKDDPLPDEMLVLEKLPLDWNQVVAVWSVAIVILVVLLWGWNVLLATG
jgi:hypothetical protein